MDSLDTQPVDIEPADPASPWQRFRIAHPTRRDLLLRRLLNSNALLTVAKGRKPLYRLPIWSMDLQRGLISLHGDQGQHRRPLPAAPDMLWGVSYLAQCKLQLELLDPHWHQGSGMWLLKARLPGAVFALQRRDSTRLRLPAHSAPVLYLPLAPMGSDPTSMLAVNIHAGGCSLWKPGAALPLQAGMALRAVEVQLDEDHILIANLTVQHVSHLQGDHAGTRAGCAWQPMTEPAQRMLSAWLARQQQRGGGMMQLLFDDL
jgi:hypothetical protein